MTAIEQEIVNRLHQMDDDDQRKVLDFIDTLHKTPPKNYSIRELKKLPPDERDRLIRESFDLAANEDFEIFEAYSEEHFSDES